MISRLTISDFRNHEDALIVPRHSFIVLTGENGAGKTNILEAVSLLAPGRGLRGATLGAMARVGGGGAFGIAARVDDITLGTGTTADAPERRQVRINGVAGAATSLAEHLSVLWLTPAMDRLFTESAGGRRRFLDRLTLALHPDQAMHSTRYEAAMRARNKLLAEGAGGDAQWVGALEVQMAEHGTALAENRADMVARLGIILAEQVDSPFARPVIAIEAWQATDVPLLDQLREGRGRDRAAGRTLSGPHRSDLAVVYAAKGQGASQCSTGEQKALLLSILLAHTQLVAQARGRPPILLLDEVAAHIDPVRRGALFTKLAATGSQVWMTGTESALFDGLDNATRLHVDAGHLSLIAA